jgi:hypothetical protein
MGAFEDGTSFLAGVLAKLPEAERAQVKAAFEKPEAKDAVTLVGDSVLARTDYSKKMDALTATQAAVATHKETLDAWYEKNKAALIEHPALKAEIDKLKAGGTDDDDDTKGKGMTVEEIQKLVDAQISAQAPDFVNLTAYMPTLALRHYQMFGEVLDAQELVANPKVGKPIVGQPGRVYSLPDAYQEKYGDRLAAKAKEADDKRVNDLVEARLKDERAKLVGQPFPLRGDATPSVLDVLNSKEGPAVHTLDAAVAEYERLTASRQST